MSLALSSRRAVLAPGPWVRNELWRRARAVPPLDLRFAENKSLVDATTGANLVTFTRASSGTYVDSQGVIRSAVTNLLLQSEDFSTTWINARSTINSNQIAAPDGSLTADKIVEDNSVNLTHLARQDVTVSANTVHTVSVYVKAAERYRIRVDFSDASTAADTVFGLFDLSAGTVISSGANGNGSLTNTLIQNVGDGWYRCIVIGKFNNTDTDGRVFLYIDNGTSISYTGDGSSGLYLWGAQLEQPSTVGEYITVDYRIGFVDDWIDWDNASLQAGASYIPTTSVINSAPRFDHDPTTGESLGLLVEESRTNLILQSEDFSTTWTETRANVSTNAIAAPDGAVTADTVTGDGTADFPQGVLQSTAAFSTAGTKTISIYAKAGTNSFLQLYTGGNANVFANFDLTAGTIGSVGTQSTAAISPAGNGWYRCVLSTSQTNPSSVAVILVNSSTAARAEVAGTSNSFYLWGAQLELGDFPTSYIPATTATVTRAADVASITTLGANIRSLFTQFRSPASGIRPVVSLDDNTANERIEILTSGTDPKLLVTDGGSAVADLDGGTVAANVAARIAARFNTDDYAISINGGASQLDSSGTLPAVDRIRIGSNQAGGYLSSTIARIAAWDAGLLSLPPIAQ